MIQRQNRIFSITDASNIGYLILVKATRQGEHLTLGMKLEI